MPTHDETMWPDVPVRPGRVRAPAPTQHLHKNEDRQRRSRQLAAKSKEQRHARLRRAGQAETPIPT